MTSVDGIFTPLTQSHDTGKMRMKVMANMMMIMVMVMMMMVMVMSKRIGSSHTKDKMKIIMMTS